MPSLPLALSSVLLGMMLALRFPLSMLTRGNHLFAFAATSVSLINTRSAPEDLTKGNKWN
jgi:hypothetical protein